jgi:hypothetical protein
MPHHPSSPAYRASRNNDGTPIAAMTLIDPDKQCAIIIDGPTESTTCSDHSAKSPSWLPV